VVLKLEECGGLDRLEELQAHPNIHIYQRTIKIIEQFFGTEELGMNDIDQTEDISIFNF